MTDFRALCAELIEAAEDMTVENDGSSDRFDAVVERARAELAVPATCDYPSCVDDSPDERCSRWLTGECQGPDSRAALAEPEPEDEAAKLVDKCIVTYAEDPAIISSGSYMLIDDGKARGALLTRIAELLAQRHPAPAPVPVSTWQPIETAPKDGTRILAVFPSRSLCIAWYARGRWTDDDLHGLIDPECWQPLPELPDA